MKKILLLLGFMLFISQYVGATQARLDGFGGLPSWAIGEDDSLIWYNPAYLSDYSNYLWAELGEVSAYGNVYSSWGVLSTDLKIILKLWGYFWLNHT